MKQKKSFFKLKLIILTLYSFHLAKFLFSSRYLQIYLKFLFARRYPKKRRHLQDLHFKMLHTVKINSLHRAQNNN